MTRVRAMDFSFSRPPYDQVSVVFRYLGDAEAALTAAEVAALHAADKGIALCFEQGKTQALDGYAQGVHDSGYANGHADALGAPADTWVWYAVDTGATVDQVRPYFQGLHAAGRRPVAFYGGLHVGLQLLAEGLIVGVWCANAASWSQYGTWDAMVGEAQAKAHVLQFLSHPLIDVAPGSYDYDEVYKPFGWWGGPPTDNPPPPSQPEGNYIVANYTDMAVIDNGKGSYRLQPDGGVITWGTAQYRGSVHEDVGAAGVGGDIAVGILPTQTGKGYWIMRLSGSVYSYGDAKYHGGYNTLPDGARQGMRFGVKIKAHKLADGSDGYTLAMSDGATYSFPS